MAYTACFENLELSFYQKHGQDMDRAGELVMRCQMYLIRSVKLLMKNQIYVKQIDCAKVDLLLGGWNYGKNSS